jgi:histidinol-phosphatase (PHP family)
LTSIENSLDKFPFDFFIGSVHHVHTVPIDYDTPLYRKARAISGGTDERLFEDYFDSQLSMLKVLKPPVVGHFDLVRLKSNDPERSFTQWPCVWGKILRNLDWIAEYGGILELNSASLRKGMSEPYPNAEICKVRRQMLSLLGPRVVQRTGQSTEENFRRNFSPGRGDFAYQMTATASTRLV